MTHLNFYLKMDQKDEKKISQPLPRLFRRLQQRLLVCPAEARILCVQDKDNLPRKVCTLALEAVDKVFVTLSWLNSHSVSMIQFFIAINYVGLVRK